MKAWEIKKVSRKASLESAAKIILQNRLTTLLDSIDTYLKDNSEENLHGVRIALRRVRYSMENFIRCFSRKTFLAFYKSISNLQDLSGSLRDLDVMKQNLRIYFDEKIFIEKKVNFSKMDNKQSQFRASLNFELMKFVHGKPLKEFKKIINA